MRFEVVEPNELTHVTVTAYYQGAPDVQGRRLQVGDRVRFELPSGPNVPAFSWRILRVYASGSNAIHDLRFTFH